MAAQTIGAVMKAAAGGPPPAWRFYFRRRPTSRPRPTRAKTKGGTIMHGPAEIPGGEFIIVGADPQGATFALVGPKK